MSQRKTKQKTDWLVNVKEVHRTYPMHLFIEKIVRTKDPTQKKATIWNKHCPLWPGKHTGHLQRLRSFWCVLHSLLQSSAALISGHFKTASEAIEAGIQTRLCPSSVHLHCTAPLWPFTNYTLELISNSPQIMKIVCCNNHPYVLTNFLPHPWQCSGYVQLSYWIKWKLIWQNCLLVYNLCQGWLVFSPARHFLTQMLPHWQMSAGTLICTVFS